EAVGPAVDLPVNVLDIVAGNVLAVLGELDGEAVIRAAMHAGEVTFDQQARLQLEAADLGEREGFQVALRVVRHCDRAGTKDSEVVCKAGSLCANQRQPSLPGPAESNPPTASQYHPA